MLIPAWLNNILFKKIIFICFTLTFFSSCDFISNKIRSKPIVKIENLQLTTQDLSKELAYRLKNLDALSAKDPKIISVFKEQIINEFIISSFIDLWFIENNLSLAKSDVEKTIRSIVSTYPTDSLFRELLSESDISYSEWTAKIEKNLKKRALVTNLMKDSLDVPENDLLMFYNENRNKFEQQEALLLSHIFIKDNNQAEIIKKLILHQKFTEVAKKYSSSFNSESGDIYGWIEKDHALGLEKFFKLNIGEIFGPVELQDGLHIFKIIEKRPFKIKGFNEVRSQILSEIMTLRETAKFYSWLDVQIKRYKVKKNLNVLNSIYVETQ